MIYNLIILFPLFLLFCHEGQRGHPFSASLGFKLYLHFEKARKIKANSHILLIIEHNLKEYTKQNRLITGVEAVWQEVNLYNYMRATAD